MEHLLQVLLILWKIFSLSFGPALMDGAFAGQICEAVIITIDEYGALRTSPGDQFSVKVVQVIPPEIYSEEEFELLRQRTRLR